MTTYYEQHREERLAYQREYNENKKKGINPPQGKSKSISIKEELEKWEESSKEYWKGRNDMPQSKILQMLIMKYGESLAVKIQEAWSIIRKEPLLQLWLTREMGE